MNKIYLSGLALAAMILAGCTTVYEGKYDFNGGWREAERFPIQMIQFGGPIGHLPALSAELQGKGGGGGLR